MQLFHIGYLNVLNYQKTHLHHYRDWRFLAIIARPTENWRKGTKALYLTRQLYKIRSSLSQDVLLGSNFHIDKHKQATSTLTHLSAWCPAWSYSTDQACACRELRGAVATWGCSRLSHTSSVKTWPEMYGTACVTVTQMNISERQPQSLVHQRCVMNMLKTMQPTCPLPSQCSSYCNVTNIRECIDTHTHTKRDTDTMTMLRRLQKHVCRDFMYEYLHVPSRKPFL